MLHAFLLHKHPVARTAPAFHFNCIGNAVIIIVLCVNDKNSVFAEVNNHKKTVLLDGEPTGEASSSQRSLMSSLQVEKMELAVLVSRTWIVFDPYADATMRVLAFIELKVNYRLNTYLRVPRRNHIIFATVRVITVYVEFV